MAKAAGQILDDYYAALKSGDMDALAQVLSPDIVVDYPGPEGLLPWIGRHEGIDAFKGFLALVSNNVIIDEVVPLEKVEAGDQIMVTLKGVWTAKATGNKISATVMNVFTIKDGRVARYQVFNDTAAFAVGMGKLKAA